jgi:hypothetical protein
LADRHGPLFSHVESYRRIKTLIDSYLNELAPVVDIGGQERLKSTSRLYEQWIFLQCVESLRVLGFRGDNVVDLVERRGRDRYVVDLGRNTTVAFRAADGRLVRLRYEPWIFSREAAAAKEEILYRGRQGEVPWSPDVLFEVLSGDGGRDSRAEYVLAIDAKYTRRLDEGNWAQISKYGEIRCTATRDKIARLLWLFYPSAAPAEPHDPDVLWTRNGPDRPPSETIEGSLGVLPPVGVDDDLEATPALAPEVLAFFSAVCRYYGLLPAAEDARATAA